jgi:hypothetical protein
MEGTGAKRVLGVLTLNSQGKTGMEGSEVLKGGGVLKNTSQKVALNARCTVRFF